MAIDDQSSNDFLRYWFEGFSEGLTKIGEEGRNEILRGCGRACARSYTAAVFKEEWKKSGEIGRFLANLAKRFPEASYRQVGEDLIEVRYNHCACDLVSAGYIKTPLFCRCSAENLKANIEGSLNRAADVRIDASILGGADQCVLIVHLH